MSLASAASSRCCTQILRSSGRRTAAARPAFAAALSQTQQQQRSSALQQQRRWESTEAAAAASPKIEAIVDQISQLNLLETADLVSTLKKRLNIPDMPMGGFAMGPGGGAPAAVAEPEEEAAPAVAEKTLFTLTLKSFDAGAKPKVIKEIKSMLGLSLVDSKKFVESAPKMMKEGVPKDDCNKIIETMKALGAVVEME